MPKVLDSSVEELRRRVDIVDVVSAVVMLKKNGPGFKGLCPFHSERSPSFNVRPGKGYACFGCGAKGDVFKFVMEREGLTFPQAVETLAGRFGVVLDYDEPVRARVRTSAPVAAVAAAEGAGAGASTVAASEVVEENVLVLPKGIDPKAAKRAIARQQRYELGKQKEEALHRRWLAAHKPGVEKRPLRVWSAGVRARFEEGVGQVSALLEVARARGWPEHWMMWLVGAELVSCPALPWVQGLGDGKGEMGDGRRSVAWRVDAPVLNKVAEVVSLVDVRAVGYHQRFMVGERKNWLFVPYFPHDRNDEGGEKWLSDFQRGLRDECVARKLAAVSARTGLLECDAVTPPLPFLLGDVAGLRFLVVTEGQWDAVTFAGAMGWLDGDGVWPSGVAVMGSRGSTGVDTLLAYWGEWLRERRPEVLVLADNDKAGRLWDEAAQTAPGELPMPTFAEKIKFAGAARVVVQRVNAALGKDFNDYWKARRPAAEGLRAWIAGMGFTIFDTKS